MISFEESWFDFAEAWDKVRFPAGAGPMDEIYRRALRADPPEVATQYESPKLRLLIALCRELQRTCGDGPFYLPPHQNSPTNSGEEAEEATGLHIVRFHAFIQIVNGLGIRCRGPKRPKAKVFHKYRGRRG